MTWARTRLKYLVAIQAGAWGGEPGELDVDVYCVRAADFDRVGLRVARDRMPVRSLDPRSAAALKLELGDLVLEKSGGGTDQPVGAAVLYDLGLPAVPSNFAARLRPERGVDHRYLTYVLAALYRRGVTDALAKQTTGIANLDVSAFMATAVSVPPSSIQSAIADYLDSETGRIDQTIAARRRAIELVQERGQAEVRSVVQADHQGTPYRVVPLRRRWDVVDCKHMTPDYQGTGIPIVSPGDATPGRLDLARCTRFVSDADYAELADGQRRPRRGDLVYTRNASIGIASYVDTDQPFSMGQDVCLIRSQDQDQRFLMYALNTIGLDQLDEQKVGSTFSRINVAQVLDLRIPCPPVATQRLIADHLDAAAKVVARLRGALLSQIGLLVERRQALIAAAVTGKLEIPGVTA